MGLNMRLILTIQRHGIARKLVSRGSMEDAQNQNGRCPTFAKANVGFFVCVIIDVGDKWFLLRKHRWYYFLPWVPHFVSRRPSPVSIHGSDRGYQRI